VEGRVLVHGQDEQTGRNYLMLEGTDAKIHFIQYTPEIEEARSRGELRVNSFVRLRKRAGATRLDVSDLGDAERLLKNTNHLSETARGLLKRGIMPTEEGWGGWLGKYQGALCGRTPEIEEKETNSVRRKSGTGIVSRAVDSAWSGASRLYCGRWSFFWPARARSVSEFT